MSRWLDSTLQRAESVTDSLTPKRQASLAQLKNAKWPSRKVEDWKYTSVSALEKLTLSNEVDATVQVAPIAGFSALELTFINGQLQALPDGLPDGLTIHSLANDGTKKETWIAELFASCKPSRHVFGLVNDVLAEQGVAIKVASGCTIEQPIRIVNLVTEGNEAHNRVLVKLEDNASVTVVEENLGSGSSMLTAYAEYQIGEQANLEHYRFALRTDASLTVGGSHFVLAREAKLNSTVVGFGSDLSRVDTDIIHRGENAHAKLNAVYLLDDKEVFDLHANVEHEVGHCVTDETIRGIVGGHSKAVFNGRIHIHRDAQKTLAELSNKNLLLSDTAQINTKPELEIYADDVRCAHGATVAELDKTALYYMTSRGVSRADALIMLNFGFINALVDEMPNEALAEWLRPQLKQRFAKMRIQ